MKKIQIKTRLEKGAKGPRGLVSKGGLKSIKQENYFKIKKI